MMKSNTFLYIAILFLSLLIPSQTNAGNFFGNMKANIDTLVISIQHKQADKKFEGLAYVKAAKKYEQIIAKGFAPDSLRRNLAISYFKLSKMEKSEILFHDLISNQQAITMDYYYYAQSLKYNQKYKEADEWIAKYHKLKKEDTRGELQYEAAPVIMELLGEERYKIKRSYFNSEYSDFGAVILDDQIIFTSARRDQAVIKYEYSWKEDPYLDIYMVPIEKPLVPKGAKLLTRGINSRYHDGPICYSPDGQEVFVTRSNFSLGLPKHSQNKENHFMLYYAGRKDMRWDKLVELPFNSPEYSCGHPSLSKDGETLYFASDKPGGYGASDIYLARRTETGWSEPENLGSDINTEGDEMFPFISSDGELYFSSNGHLGLGGLDIFMAAQSQNSYTILNMGHPLNSSSDDFSFYLYTARDGYFASNRSGGSGDDDIYSFSMEDIPVYLLKLEGIVKSRRTGELIPNAMVVITDATGNELLKVLSDTNAEFKTEITPDTKYQILATEEKFQDLTMNYQAAKKISKGETLRVELLLEDIREWGVFGFIFEKESGAGVDSVTIQIIEKETRKTIYEISDSEGKFRRLLEPETDYDLVLKKRKFFARRGEFTTKDMEPGWIDIKEFIEVEMEEIVVGKTIEIPNIYYDLAKWSIRPDAAVELDKVVQFLLDNETITIELGSHTDARGSSASNQTLSQKRAESAVNYIVDHGINRNRISAKGYGELKLKNRCADGVHCSKEEHQENRRTEIKIVDF